MMTCRFRSAVILALGLLIVASYPASGKELEDREWIEVRTPNYQIRSALSEKDTIKLVRHLEMFRVAVSIVTNISSLDSPIPTEIYALRGKSDFENLGIDRELSVGIFVPGLRENLIVIRDARGVEETSVIMHEYVHFLLRNHGSANYPRWYEEGFAEYLSAASMRAGKFEVGGIPKIRSKRLSHSRWIPLRKILSPEDYGAWSKEHKLMFYAEAWALVHYLQNRSDRDTSLGQDMTRYIELVDSGMGDIEAFEEAFMITPEDLDRQVKRYLKGGLPSFRWPIDKLLPDFKPDVISLSREQISLALGQAALRLGELGSAKHWFTIAATDELSRPRAEAGLGRILEVGGDFEAAQPHFELAVALAPSDPYCQLDIAFYWYLRARRSNEPGDLETYLARAREHYVKAWKLDDSIPETYARYGETFVMEGRRYDYAIELLEQAESILPSSITVRMYLARAYFEADRKEDAVAAASSVLAWSHDESARAKAARAILILAKQNSGVD